MSGRDEDDVISFTYDDGPIEYETKGAIEVDGRTRPDFASDHKRRAAAFLFSQGYGYHRVAWLLEIPQSCVREWLRSWKKGQFKTELTVKQYRYSEERRREAMQMRRTGMSWSEIYRKTGISSATIRKWLDQEDERLARQKEQDEE